MMTRLIPLAAAFVVSACAKSTPTASTPVQTAATTDGPIVALVLGGGGTRGFAHVGVIESLEAHGIRPDLIVGTSVGAMVGSVYASGVGADQLSSIAESMNESDLIDIAPSKQGLIDGTPLRQFVNAQVGHQPIEKFPIRFAAVATEMQSKQAVVIRQGEAGLAVQASSSVPNLFIAPRIPENGGQKYVDGSVSALLPARIARSLGADVVISVDLMAKAAETDTNSTVTKPNTVSIQRDDQGIGVTWGEQAINIPIDLNKMNEASKELPFDLPLGDIFGSVIKAIPANQTINLPKQMPASLPKSPDEFWQLFGHIGSNIQANPADIAASDVLISPDLAKVPVFDASGRTAVINAGKAATNAEIEAIKQAIATAEYQYLGKVQ